LLTFLQQKETAFEDYAAVRIARLWSVLLPALAITYVMDWCGMKVRPEVYQDWGPWLAADGSPLRLLVSAVFLNELWFRSIIPLSNGLAWSIGFEFGYHAIFAAFTFPKGVMRCAMPAVAVLFAGPRVLLLFPVRLMGVANYRVGSERCQQSSFRYITRDSGGLGSARRQPNAKRPITWDCGKSICLIRGY